MLQQVRRFLRSLAGAREEVLDQCPTEQVRFESLGWSLLITSCMAVISMWFALSTAMGINGLIAIFPALFWGLVILGIDRWLITSMPRDSTRKALVAAPRLALALLLGTLISTPFVLRIFESEINVQISLIKEQQYDQFVAQQQKSDVGTQVTYWTNQVNALNQVINSRGAQPLNPAADPDVKALTGQRDKAQMVANQEFKTWQCQLYGVYQGVKCPKGNGPLAQASHTTYLQDQAQVSQLNAAIQAREKTLAANDAASQKTRLQQAQNALPYAQSQLAIARQRQDNLRSAFAAENTALNGILIRLEALSQLSHDNFTVTSARWLIFLLFLVIECLPVTVKLMQRPGLYEKILAGVEDDNYRSARRRGFRSPSEAEASGSRDGQTRVMVVRPHAGQQSAVVRGVFERTKALPGPVGDPADQRETERLRDGYQNGIGYQNGPGDAYNGGRRPHGPDEDWQDDPYASNLRRGGTRPGAEVPDSGDSWVNGRRRDGAAWREVPVRDQPYPEDAPARSPDVYLQETARDHGYLSETARDHGYLGETRPDRTPDAGRPVVAETVADDARRDPRRRPRQNASIMSSGGLPQLDPQLRGMDDNRLSTDSDGQTGVPLSWDEE
jgi:hypothetical protein